MYSTDFDSFEFIVTHFLNLTETYLYASELGSYWNLFEPFFLCIKSRCSKFYLGCKSASICTVEGGNEMENKIVRESVNEDKAV